MNRVLKFRCWSDEEKQYFPMQTVNFLDNKPISVGYHKKGHKGFLHMRFPKFILEQYTGLKDKNGKEICEGDIVDYCSECTCVVQYEDEGARFIHRDISDDFPFGFNGLGEYNEKLFEVIGNIHENPELLGSRSQEAKERRKNEVDRCTR